MNLFTQVIYTKLLHGEPQKVNLKSVFVSIK